jgi:hypothetical protein
MSFESSSSSPGEENNLKSDGEEGESKDDDDDEDERDLWLKAAVLYAFSTARNHERYEIYRIIVLQEGLP